jgi:aminoglycoside phosphotransferase (APT) family kinase protein
MSKSVLGCIFGSGKAAEVFEFGSDALKLYKPAAPKRSAFREAATLALVESFGLPAPQVRGVRQIEGRWGIVMTRAEGPSFAETMRRQPDLVAEYLKRMALLQQRVHSHHATQLGSLKMRLEANIRQATALGETQKNALSNRLAGMPDGDRLCHGDFHPLNLLGPPGHETLVDWLDATRGDPAADVCRSYVLIRRMAPQIAAAYVDAYVAVSDESPERISSWLPFVAAARLAEGVPEEADELVEMARHPFIDAL